jgi:outer membrane protein assembly factor BamB
MRKKNVGYRNLLLPLTFLVIADGQALVLAQSALWPQFLGPNRNGISPATDVMTQWPAGGPEVLWRAEGGVGMSGISVSDNFAITMWNSSAGQVVVALNPATGKQIWSTPLSRNYENAMGNGPRATPAISGDQVYAFTGDGILACLKLDDGKVVWSENVVAGVGGKAAEYGMACSPLIIGDLVIVTAGGQGSAVVAVDASTGKTRWTAVDGTPGYSSPALLKVAGEDQVVAFTGQGLSGINPGSGAVLWQYPFKTPYDCNTVTPIEVDGKIFIAAGENHGCVMLAVTRNDSGYSVNEVWESTNVKSVMRNEWQTSVLIDGFLYGFDNVGSAGPVTHLTCVNAKTGQTVWRENRFGKGNLVAANGILWITTMKGEFVMVKATASGFEELGRKQIFGKTRQAVSIADGNAYIRDDAQVVCIKIK